MAWSTYHIWIHYLLWIVPLKAVVVFVFQLHRSPLSVKSWTIRYYPVGGDWQPAWYLPAWSDMRCKICSIVVMKPTGLLASLLCGPAFRRLGAVLLAHNWSQIRLATSVYIFVCVLVHGVYLKTWYRAVFSSACTEVTWPWWHLDPWCRRLVHMFGFSSLIDKCEFKYNTKGLTWSRKPSPCNWMNARTARDTIFCILTLILNLSSAWTCWFHYIVEDKPQNKNTLCLRYCRIPSSPDSVCQPSWMETNTDQPLASWSSYCDI